MMVKPHLRQIGGCWSCEGDDLSSMAKTPMQAYYLYMQLSNMQEIMKSWAKTSEKACNSYGL